MCYPQQLGRFWKVFVPEPSGTLSAMCTGQLSNFVCYLGPSELNQPPGTLQNLTVRDLIRHLHRNPPELFLLCPPDSSAILSAICSKTLRNFISFLPLKPSGTSSAICAGTLRKLICYLHRNSPELHQPAAPELSGTSSAICAGNLISNLHRKAPEPSGTFSGTWCCSCTGSHQSFSGLKTP